jgi:HAD superfamily phosphatase (TIGR01668 family)
MKKLKQPKSNGFLMKIRPNYTAKSITDINFSLLNKQGVRYLAIDVDSTLVVYGSVEMNSKTLHFLKEIKKKQQIKQIVLATNRQRRNLSLLAHKLDASIIHARGLRRKPRRLFFQDVIDHLRAEPQTIAMIGDKLFTDVLGGNRAGMVTILVERHGPDLWLERPLRLIEQQIHKIFNQ